MSARIRRRGTCSGGSDPDRRSNPFQPVLDALGLKTYNAYAKGVRSVSLQSDRDEVTITPTRNGGPREGFVFLDDQVSLAPLSDPSERGRRIREALDLCC